MTEIIWRSLGEDVEELHLELSGADDTEYSETYRTAELEELHG